MLFRGGNKIRQALECYQKVDNNISYLKERKQISEGYIKTNKVTNLHNFSIARRRRMRSRRRNQLWIYS